MTLIEEYAIDNALNGLIDRRIREYDVRRFAAKLQCVLLIGTRQCALNDATNVG